MGMQPPLTMQSKYPAAPELAITRWFNTANNLTLAGLTGEVVVIEAFQMLCPGCVSHGLPQVQAHPTRLRRRRHRARAPLRVRTPRRHDPCVTRSVSVRVPHHVPGRCRRPRSRGSPCPSRWAGSSYGAPRAWWSSTGPDASASARLDRSTTSSSVPPSPASSTNLSPTRRPPATPTSDVLPQPGNPTPSRRRRPRPQAVRRGCVRANRVRQGGRAR